MRPRIERAAGNGQARVHESQPSRHIILWNGWIVAGPWRAAAARSPVSQRKGNNLGALWLPHVRGWSDRKRTSSHKAPRLVCLIWAALLRAVHKPLYHHTSLLYTSKKKKRRAERWVNWGCFIGWSTCLSRGWAHAGLRSGRRRHQRPRPLPRQEQPLARLSLCCTPLSL